MRWRSQRVSAQTRRVRKPPARGLLEPMHSTGRLLESESKYLATRNNCKEWDAPRTAAEDPSPVIPVSPEYSECKNKIRRVPGVAATYSNKIDNPNLPLKTNS